MPSDIRIRFATSATYPGSQDATSNPSRARDLDDTSFASTPASTTVPLRNGFLLTSPSALPVDLGTLDSVDIRLRIRHDSGPPFPGILENYHVVFASYDSGGSWTRIQGGENALPTTKNSEQTVRVTLSPPPTPAEWPNLQILLQNWVGFTGSGLPTDP